MKSKFVLTIAIGAEIEGLPDIDELRRAIADYLTNPEKPFLCDYGREAVEAGLWTGAPVTSVEVWGPSVFEEEPIARYRQ